MRVVKHYRKEKLDAKLEVRGSQVFEVTFEHGTDRPKGGSRHHGRSAIELYRLIVRLSETDVIDTNLPEEWVDEGVESVSIAP